MRYFPLFLDLAGQKVLVVGAGNVGERKIRLLLQAGALPQVVARGLSDTIRCWVAAGTVVHVAETFEERQLDGQRLVFAATGDSALNRAVFQAAEARGIPVNVVDDRTHCRFISPAVVDRGPVQIAISTGGAAPLLARRLRVLVEGLLPAGLGRVAGAADQLRRCVRRQLPKAARRVFWESVLTEANLVRWSGLRLAQVRSELSDALRGAVRSGQRSPAVKGRVYLVGAGPGNPDLLTLRALQVLGQADVILHDQLVPDTILNLGRRDADRIDVGKKAGDRKNSQDCIQRRMIAEAQLGRSVVRLKGGDPFVFGRGGEEIQALHQAGIGYEVVPGITAAVGCAAYAGIPLTHRGLAHTLTFVTGHLAARSPGDSQPAIDWAGMAGEGRTLVVYMGVRQAARIRAELLRAGLALDFPLVLVVNGTREGQKVLTGTLRELPELAAAVPDGSPGLLIIGQVAALGSNLCWSQEKPARRAAA